MAMDVQAHQSSPARALVLIPQTVNYFYNQNGHRIAEALRDVGLDVEVCGLGEWQEGTYDYAILSNVTEILHAYGNEAAGLQRLATVRANCKTVASCSIDCVRTPWYQRLHDLSRHCQADVIIDLGLYDQTEFLEPKLRPAYRFVYSGLTPSERATLDSDVLRHVDGPIPWSFVGHYTPERVALVDYLLQAVDSRGFVYMPSLAPYPEKKSPHLNQQQFEMVLRRTRYQVWCSHHTSFYMEPERFRTSLLTGGLPIKVLAESTIAPDSAPFAYLMTPHRELVERMTAFGYDALRQRYQQEWRAAPSLSEELTRVLPVVPRSVQGTERKAA